MDGPGAPLRRPLLRFTIVSTRLPLIRSLYVTVTAQRVGDQLSLVVHVASVSGSELVHSRDGRNDAQIHSQKRQRSLVLFSVL